MDLLEAAQRLCELEEAKCVATLEGGCMLMTEIRMHDGQDLTRLISNGIKSMEGVRRISPAFLLEKLKGR